MQTVLSILLPQSTTERVIEDKSNEKGALIKFVGFSVDFLFWSLFLGIFLWEIESCSVWISFSFKEMFIYDYDFDFEIKRRHFDTII